MARTANGSKPFVQITNQQIYEEILAIRKSLEGICDKVNSHTQRMGFITKLIGGAYLFAMSILGWFMAHLLGGN